jgi:hypothetical protein
VSYSSAAPYVNVDPLLIRPTFKAHRQSSQGGKAHTLDYSQDQYSNQRHTMAADTDYYGAPPDSV